MEDRWMQNGPDIVEDQDLVAMVFCSLIIAAGKDALAFDGDGTAKKARGFARALQEELHRPLEK
jgi:hypothetical protein